MRKEKEVLVRN